jgi:hypothetical protein
MVAGVSGAEAVDRPAPGAGQGASENDARSDDLAYEAASDLGTVDVTGLQVCVVACKCCSC